MFPIQRYLVSQKKSDSCEDKKRRSSLQSQDLFDEAEGRSLFSGKKVTFSSDPKDSSLKRCASCLRLGSLRKLSPFRKSASVSFLSVKIENPPSFSSVKIENSTILDLLKSGEISIEANLKKRKEPQ